MWPWLGITLLAVAGALLWLWRRAARRRRPRDPDARDEAVLREAEDEVRDLDALTPPEEADEGLTDWGPGAPR
jgi:hypothetical protein